MGVCGKVMSWVKQGDNSSGVSAAPGSLWGSEVEGLCDQKGRPNSESQRHQRSPDTLTLASPDG